MPVPIPDCPLVRDAADLLPELREVFYARAQEGFEKYGQYLSQNTKPERHKAVHALQEDMDALLYELWAQSPSARRIELRLELMRNRLAEFPDLTFEELTFKEGHSARDYKGRLQELGALAEVLLSSNLTPRQQQQLEAVAATRFAVGQQQLADLIRERTERRLAGLGVGGA